MLNKLIFTAWLALPPTETSYEQSLADLDAAAQSIAEVSPAEAIAEIEQSLAAVAQHPAEILRDSTAADKIARARLSLVWAYIAEGNTEAATRVLDEAIRSSDGRDFPLAGLGPDVRKFSEVRRTQLQAAGTATIEIDCEACQVLVGETVVENPTSPLLLGAHRVWVFDPSGTLQPELFEVVLVTPGETVTLVFRPPPPIAEIETETERQPPPRWPKQRPLGYGGLATAGVGMIATIVGASLWGVGEIGEGFDPNRSIEHYLDVRPAGQVLTVIGLLATVTGGSLLAVDIFRYRRAVRSGQVSNRRSIGGMSFRVSPGYTGLQFRTRF